VIDRLRLIACPESPEVWSFHLLNQSEERIDAAIVTSVDYEWGDTGSPGKPGTPVGPIAAGQSAEVWRGSDGEMRMDLTLTISHGNRHHDVTFSFGKLYKLRGHVAEIPGFDQRGIVAHVE
jgi:hypothetical protein